MKSLILLITIVLATGCAQKLNKPDESAVAPNPTLETTVAPSSPVIDATTPVGKNIDQIRKNIFELEAETFGDVKSRQVGMVGDLKLCKTKLASTNLGGSGTFLWDEPTEKLSEEWLKKKDIAVEIYQAVFMVAQYRRDYFKKELSACQSALSAKGSVEPNISSVQVVEGDSDNDERVHSFVCSYVHRDASLRDFLIQAFSRGTLKLEDFDLSQNLLVTELKDKSGKGKPYGLMYMGWKLSFNKGPLTLKEILLDRKDATLQYWTFSGSGEAVKDTKTCLKKGVNTWNG